MIQIPAPPPRARDRATIAAGITSTLTLLFSIEAYKAVALAFVAVDSARAW